MSINPDSRFFAFEFMSRVAAIERQRSYKLRELSAVSRVESDLNASYKEILRARVQRFRLEYEVALLDVERYEMLEEQAKHEESQRP